MNASTDNSRSLPSASSYTVTVWAAAGVGTVVAAGEGRAVIAGAFGTVCPPPGSSARNGAAPASTSSAAHSARRWVLRFTIA